MEIDRPAHRQNLHRNYENHMHFRGVRRDEHKTVEFFFFFYQIFPRNNVVIPIRDLPGCISTCDLR